MHMYCRINTYSKGGKAPQAKGCEKEQKTIKRNAKRYMWK